MSASRCSKYRGSAISDPFVFTKKTVWMQRVGDAVRAGAAYYIQGATRFEKVPVTLQRFGARYHVNLGRASDLRARQAGQDVARWIGYHEESSGLVHWVLLYWPGTSPDPTERWMCPTVDRLQHSGYELVRITKVGASRPVWTWRYTKQRYQGLRDQLVGAIRLRQDAAVDQIIHSLARSPGFAGVRTQVKQLWRLIGAEWKRGRSMSEPLPNIPKNIGYVRRLPDAGASWSALAKRPTGWMERRNDGDESFEASTR
jgi:hypothetical protein